MLMNNSDIFYNQPIRPSSSSTFTSSPTKSVKNIGANNGHSDQDHLVIGNDYQISSNDLSITGQQIKSGHDFSGSFPPPPPHVLDVQSQDSNYDYSTVAKCPKYAPQKINKIVVQASSRSPQKMKKQNTKSQGQVSTKNSIHKHTHKGSKREEKRILERPKSKIEENEEKDWMPMRQLFNAHKL